MLNEKLVKFCDDNFDDGKLILTKLSEYKKILIKENENMNLIGKSTLIDVVTGLLQPTSGRIKLNNLNLSL